jgi:hypothetical protein
MTIQCKYRFFATALFIVVIFMPVRISHAHEPIFGLGPHVIYKGGIGVEVEFEGGKASGGEEREKEYSLHTEVIYGITSDLAVTLAFPYIIEKSAEKDGIERKSSGIGDLSLRLKYRFWRHDRPGIQDSAAVIGGIKLPTGDDGEIPKLGSGSTDFLFGITAARESLKWYYFGDLRYRVNTRGSGGLRKGNRFFADFSIGVRPWPPVYLKPDLVVLAELNWESIMRDSLDGTEVEDSGGNQLFFSPSFFLTYRNWAIKGGVQIPVYQNLYGEQPEDDYRFSFSVEIHY